MFDALLRFLLHNPIVLLFLVLSILPALGRGLKNVLTKAAEQAKKNQERMRRDDGSMPRGPRAEREPREPRAPTSHEPEDIAREIRRMMGLDPVAEPVVHEEPPRPPPPAPLPQRPPRVHRERKQVERHAEADIVHAEPAASREVVPVALSIQVPDLVSRVKVHRSTFRLGDPRRAVLLLEVLSPPVALREGDERW